MRSRFEYNNNRGFQTSAMEKYIADAFFPSRPLMSYEKLSLYVCAQRVCVCVCRWKLISFAEIICKTLAILLRHNVFLSLWDWCVCVLCYLRALLGLKWIPHLFGMRARACVCLCRKHFSAHERHKKWIVAALFRSHQLIYSIKRFLISLLGVDYRGNSHIYEYKYKYIKHKCEARKSKHTNWHLNI